MAPVNLYTVFIGIASVIYGILLFVLARHDENDVTRLEHQRQEPMRPRHVA